jgi:predicted nucleic acid-binding protein
MVILDTNIIIDHVRCSKKTEHLTILQQLVRAQPDQSQAVSTITIQELYEGQSSKDPDKERDLLRILSPMKVLSYNLEIARLAGKIARDNSPTPDLADAAIAATAISYNLPLLTLNQKHFKHIVKLKLAPLNFTT